MTYTIVAKASSQKNPAFSISARVVVQPNTWYTCPAGKTALVKGLLGCTGLGAAANAQLDISGIKNARWTTTGLLNVAQRNDLAVDMYVTFEAELAAGDTIVTTQNVGANAEFDMNAFITELPA